MRWASGRLRIAGASPAAKLTPLRGEKAVESCAVNRFPFISSRIRNGLPLTVESLFTGIFARLRIRDSFPSQGKTGRNAMRWRSKCSLALCIAFPATGGLAAEALPAIPPPISAMAGPDMLGTVAMPIRADRFGDSLRRAREDASRSPALLHLVLAARPLPPLQQLSFVQQAVNARIHWMSDATEWGQHDYWASAAQTLSRGAGDMEDRAIVKLQALRALGFSNSDLFLTLARDRVAGPLTVLIVRTDGRYYVLDDTAGAPFPAEQRRFELQPIMSFGLYGAWVHVRPTAIASAGGTSNALAHK